MLLAPPIAAIVLSFAALTAPCALLGEQDSVPDRLLVKPVAGAAEAAVQALFRQHGALETDRIAAIDVRILRVPEFARDRILEALQHNPEVAFAEGDAILEPDVVPDDPLYPNEWHLPKIQAPEAWGITRGGSSVIIAVLDSGVDGSHPDLAPNLVPGWNFYSNNADTSDVTGHGTGVAGVVAALGDNSLGVASVAFGCRIMPLRISDSSGNTTYSMLATALSYAADHGARVANISYKTTDSATVASAAQYFQSKGGVTAVSAGNEGTFDSAADNPYILTVSATGNDDLLTSWSCTGNNIDLAAPGQGIMTTVRGGGYAGGTGTSFSAPIVAGVAALVLSANPALSGSQVQDLLKQTADDLGQAGWDTAYGWGRVNAYKAVLAASGGSPASLPDTTAPAVSISAPLGGSTISGTTTLTVGAADNVGVARIECYINGTLAGTATASPASFSWNTTTYPDGSYNLQAKAYDAAGNSGKSAIVTVSVRNATADATAPTAMITSPSSSSTVTGIVPVTVSASDNIGVTRIDWFVNGVLAGTSNSDPATFSWNTASGPDGLCNLQARAYDAAGNSGTSSVLNVTVRNTADTTAPTVRITSPANGSALVRNTKIYVTAGDDLGVTRVDLLVDGRLYGSSSSATPVFTWNTSKASRGSHTLQAAAYDAAGNAGLSSIVTVNK